MLLHASADALPARWAPRTVGAVLVVLATGCQGRDGTPSTSESPAPTYSTGTGDTGPTGPVTVTLVATPRPHGLELTATPTPPSSRLRCEAPDIPDEVHEAVDPFEGGAFELLGLLADTTYHCTLLQPADATTDTAVELDEAEPATTPRSAAGTNWHIAEHVPERRSGAYTLFNLGDGDSEVEPHQLLMVDPEGRLRWTHLVAEEFPDCDVRYQDDGTILYGGGQGISPTILSLAGDVQWSAPDRSFEERYHHHAERLGDGTVLTMRHTAERPPAGQGQPDQTWVGFRIERIAVDGMIPWSWTSQRAVDEGWLPIPHPNASDPWHANSVHVDDEGMTYVNLRQKSWMLAIDDGGEVQWRLGAEGDFDLVDADGTPLGDEHWFHGAHDPEVHEGPDGTLRILFHDNGYGRGVAPAYSQVLELVVDVGARTATRTWTWTEPDWYEPIWGDADELPDGGVLITKGHCGGCGPSQVSELVEVDRTSGEVDWRLRFDSAQWGVYRAQRIDGCAIFHHTGYCSP